MPPIYQHYDQDILADDAVATDYTQALLSESLETQNEPLEPADPIALLQADAEASTPLVKSDAKEVSFSFEKPTQPMDAEQVGSDSLSQDPESLIKAVQSQDEAMVKLLLQNKAMNVNKEHLFGTSLVYAVRSENQAIVELFLQRPDIDVNLGSPLTGAAVTGNSAIAKRLLDHPNIDVNHGHALAKASEYGQQAIIELLLQHPDIDVNHGHALTYAAMSVHQAIAELLLQHPNIDPNHGRPLMFAALAERQAIVELLLQHPKTLVTDESTAKKLAQFGYSRIEDQELTKRIAHALAKFHDNKNYEALSFILETSDYALSNSQLASQLWGSVIRADATIIAKIFKQLANRWF